MLTLPEGQENHRLHRAELQHRIVRCQQITRRKVEQIQAVQGQRHRNIVHRCDVDVAVVVAPVAVVVVAQILQNDDDERHQRLDQAELQRRLLAEAQKTDGVGLAAQTASAVHARRLDRLPSDLRHDVALAAQILVAQRQKVVYHKG